MQTIKRTTQTHRSRGRRACGPVKASTKQLTRLRKELGNRIGPAADTLLEILAVEPEVKREDLDGLAERIIAQSIATKLELELLISKMSAENREAVAAAVLSSEKAVASAVLSSEKAVSKLDQGIAAAREDSSKAVAAAVLSSEKAVASAVLSSEKATSKLEQRINILIAVVVVAAAFTSPIASSVLLRFVK